MALGQHLRRPQFVEAYARLLAAKLYGARATDYVRSATLEDRRYLLFTPITKMRVTMEGERIVSLLGEVISAKGFERDSYFEAAKNIVGDLRSSRVRSTSISRWC